jgi:hypothetical protein
MGKLLKQGRPLGIEAVEVPAVLPDQGGRSHQRRGLKDHPRDLESVEYLQSRGVVTAKAIVETDDHPKAVWTRELAASKIGEGEKVCPPGLEKGQFPLQLPGGDRRNAIAIEEGDPAGCIHPVIEQTQDLAPEPLAPEGSSAGHE